MGLFPPPLLRVPYAIRIEQIDANTSYIGKADPGSADSAAVWQIQRITVNGIITSVLWAGGTDEFDQIWDDRAILSYS